MALDLLSYLGARPQPAAPPRYFGAGAAVIGRAVLGTNCRYAAELARAPVRPAL